MNTTTTMSSTTTTTTTTTLNKLCSLVRAVAWISSLLFGYNTTAHSTINTCSIATTTTSEPIGSSSSSTSSATASSTSSHGADAAVAAAASRLSPPQTEIMMMEADALTATTGSSSVLRSDNNNSSMENDHSAAPLECGIWLAPSTIPGAGLGMYAGRSFVKGEWLQDMGDIAIPIIDIRYHMDDDYFVFLWDEYTWNAENLQMDQDGYNDIHVASPGFGAAANCLLPLQNVDEWNPVWNDSGLHRARDPGAGAISPYGNRTSTAMRNIAAGEELFVSYGEHWFEGREFLGAVPLTKDLERATTLFQSFLQLRNTTQAPKQVLDQLWQIFIQNTTWRESRVLGAFNHSDPKEFRQLLSRKNMTEIRLEKSVRDAEWLQKYGVCGDHIGVAPSTIKQAGQGAFARRDLPKGTVVATLPLIHIPDRSVFEMYHFDETSRQRGKPVPNPKLGIQGYQVMTNYCLGHRSSSLLLCPYGPHVTYINHNQTQTNVKFAWADPARGNHQPNYLQMSVRKLANEYSSKLAMDVIATRDIKAGEEIFLDYGDEFEAAWNEHVRNWKPVPGADSYINSMKINRDFSKPFPTEFDLLENPIPNIELWCSNSFLSPRWKEFYPDRIDEFTLNVHGQTYPCDLLRSRLDEHGNYLYTAILWFQDVESNRPPEIVGKLVDVPRHALTYYDRPYTTDMFLPNAFRHDIRIPDNLFPAAWRNIEYS